MDNRFSVSPLKLARMQSGLRQGEVARMLGCSQSKYSLRENGHAAVPLGDAKKLAKILNTPIEKLFPGDES